MHLCKLYHAILLCAPSSYYSLSIHRLHPRSPSIFRGAEELIHGGEVGKSVGLRDGVVNFEKVPLKDILQPIHPLPHISLPHGTPQPHLGSSLKPPLDANERLSKEARNFIANIHATTGDRWSPYLKQLNGQSKKTYKSLKQWFQSIKERISSRIKIGGRTTTVDSDTTQAVANNRWSQILLRLKTESVKLRDNFSNTMRWLKSFRFRSRTVPKPDPEAEPPKTFSDGIDLLGKALAGDIRLTLKPIEGTDQSLLDQMIGYLAPKPPPGETLSKDQLNLKNRIAELLKSSRLQKLDKKAIKKFEEQWNIIGEIINGGKKDEISNILASVEAKENMIKSLEDIDPKTFSRILDTELNSAGSSISGDLPTKIGQMYDAIPPRTKFHILDDNEKTDLMKTYAYLRTYKPSEESEESHVDPLETLVQNLPQDGRDLGPRFIRYAMMIQFENILQGMGKLLAPDLKISLQNKIDSGKIGSVEFAKSLFASPAEKDAEWRKSAFLAGHSDNLNPSDIFRNLQANADDKGRIKYALHRMANSLTFLEDGEKHALNLATDRISFRKVMAQIKGRYPDKTSERDTLDLLQAEAINIRSANHPYAQELYEKGYIDEATLAKLNPSEGYLLKIEFATRLGTEQEFEKVLYDKFEATVLKRMDSHQKKIKDVMVADLTKSYLDQLTTVAQNIYLKPDAILKPDSFKFDAALRKFDPAFLDELVNSHPQDLNQLKKKYVDAAVNLGASSTQPQKYSGTVTRFLDAMKIPPVTLHPKDIEGGIVSKSQLSGYDPRFYEIYLHPVTAGDSRLRGTQYENLPEGFRIALNNAAKKFFDKVGEVDATVRQAERRAKQIKELKASFTSDQKLRLQGIINEMLKTRILSRFSRGKID